MTKDDIIETAIQLGFDERLSNNWLVSEEQLMRFAKLVAAKEREACAKVIENDCIDDMTREEEAAAIRSRGRA